MKKYWLYMESYAVIFVKGETALIYNTISGQHFKIDINNALAGMICQLQDVDNGYCIEIFDADLKTSEIDRFVTLLRENLCGDIIDQQFTTAKPFSLYPMHNVMKKRERLKNDQEFSIGEKVMDYLHALTIQITGKCALNCDSCMEYRQVLSCHASPSMIDVESLDRLFYQISGSSLNVINLIGGNIFEYPHWHELLATLKKHPHHYNFYQDYRLISAYISKINTLSELDALLTIIVRGDFDENILIRAIADIPNQVNFALNFHVSSEKEYMTALNFCENHRVSTYELYPVFSCSAPEFFKESLYLDEESILASPIAKNTIFMNQSVNIFDFGKINIFSNGDAYANCNFPPLGNIAIDSVHDILCREMEEGKSWFRIRDKAPCTKCLYQWLCPSPSNYEIAIGQPNLCVK